ncbi:histidine kinase [Streptomyces sp. ADMS]|uniref:histidine kinase n=1 Tax=Streptomyces sp. ADMS TaxID=3071415 RepID=UPI00296EA2F7|nr:histidine kinase [Streptomyces sp. ADMS]MDW4905267.1 histidine kinase [Streptomyces sp. ADMS]
MAPALQQGRPAARATVQLVAGAILAFGSYIFITVLLITATVSLAVVGIGMLPETVLLIRRFAGTKRRMAAEWSGVEIPEAYLPIEGKLKKKLRTVVRDPGTRTDLRWMFAHYVYGALPLLMIPLWPVGLVVDGVWCGLLGRKAVVLPLISRLADLDAAWSAALLKPSPKAQLVERVEQLKATRADAVAAHGAELRRIERDLHDGAQARLVSLSMRIGLAKRAYDRDPDAARKLLEDAQDQAEEALTELRNVVRGIHPPILTDRGLVGAVRALASSSGLEVGGVDDGVEDGVRARRTRGRGRRGQWPRGTPGPPRTPPGRRRTGRPDAPGFRDEGLRAALEARERIPGLPVLVLSQYVEESYAAELLGGGASGVGYLLKDRVGRVDEFLDALDRVAAGGTALDPEVVAELLTRRRDSPPRLPHPARARGPQTDGGGPRQHDDRQDPGGHGPLGQ